MGEWLTQAAFAREVGVSQQRVSRAIAVGILSESVKRVKSGKKTFYRISATNGLKEWHENTDPSMQRDRGGQKAAATRAVGKSKTPTANYQSVKALNEFYKAQLSKLEYESRIGRYISVDAVKRECFRIGRLVRESVMGVADRTAAEVAHMSNQREIRFYLRTQLAAALKDLKALEDVGTKD